MPAACSYPRRCLAGLATATECQEQLRACGGGNRRAWWPCCGGARVWVRSLSPSPTRLPSLRGVVLRSVLTLCPRAPCRAGQAPPHSPHILRAHMQLLPGQQVLRRPLRQRAPVCAPPHPRRVFTSHLVVHVASVNPNVHFCILLLHILDPDRQFLPLGASNRQR
jgi:hypothetical protein